MTAALDQTELERMLAEEAAEDAANGWSDAGGAPPEATTPEPDAASATRDDEWPEHGAPPRADLAGIDHDEVAWSRADGAGRAARAVVDPRQVSTNDEDILIGSVLATPEIYAQVSFVQAFDLVDRFAQDAWRAIGSTMRARALPSPGALKALSQGLDVDRLEDLARRAPANPEACRAAARRIADVRRCREAADVLETAARQMRASIGNKGEADWRTLMSEASRKAVGLSASNRTRNASVVEDLVRKRGSTPTERLRSGIQSLDDFLGGGFQERTLIAIGATTKSGKTTLAASLSYNFEAQGKKHLAIILERHDTEFELLKIARHAKRLGNRIEPETLRHLPPLPFARTCEYHHVPGATWEELRSEILHQVWINGARAVILDYWQLVGGRAKGEQAEAHLTRVAQGLQQVAYEIEVPVIVLVQHNEYGASDIAPHAMKQAANTYLVLHRDQGSNTAYFENHANNIGHEYDVGTHGEPSLFLCPEGPHFMDIAEAKRLKLC